MIEFSKLFQKYRIQVILGSVLIFFFLLSFILFLVFGGKHDRRFFYYPVNGYRKNSAELHYVPSRKSKEKQLKVFVSELVLGPVDISLAPLFPEGTRVRTLIFRNGILYIDFNRMILDFTDKNPLTLDQIFLLTQKNINSNFMGIKKIIFTIDGRKPGSPPVISEES